MNLLHEIYSLVSRVACWGKSELIRLKVIKQIKTPLPVISVGNLTVGGSEKTPLAMELLAFLQNSGLKPALISRGYKWKWEKEGGVLSDGKTLFGSWEAAGDEPYMAALLFPGAGVFIGKHRARSCQKAKEMGFDAAILDDGFQHIKLGRDVDIVLYDACSGSSRACREGLSALKRADILLWKQGGREDIRQRIQSKFPSLSIYEYSFIGKGVRSLERGGSVPPGAMKGKKILAFCGIARPERFFSLLEFYGIAVQMRMAFPDHFFYPQRAFDKIAAASAAGRYDALITSEKDAVKLSGRTRLFVPAPVYVLSIGLDLPPVFFDKIREALALKIKSQARLKTTQYYE